MDSGLDHLLLSANILKVQLGFLAIKSNILTNSIVLKSDPNKRKITGLGN